MTLRVAILGAGAIGCWVGGRLASAGAAVTLVGRERMGAALLNGFRVSDHAGETVAISPDRFRFATDPATLARADIVLVAVKGPDTGEAAREVARHARPDVPVVSLQNGIGPAEELARVVGMERTVPAAVVFNVVRPEPDRFHRATDGPIVLSRGAVEALDGRGLPIARTDNIEGVRWGKLMLNLVNGPNALSGLSLRAHLLDREWRLVFARSIAEALRVAGAKGVRVERVGRVHPALARRVLPLSNFLFTRIARAMMRVDPTARTSMSDDLDAGRRSEIETLNGAVIREGGRLGVATPVNDAVAAAVREAFRRGESPRLSGEAFLAGIDGG